MARFLAFVVLAALVVAVLGAPGGQKGDLGNDTGSGGKDRGASSGGGYGGDQSKHEEADNKDFAGGIAEYSYKWFIHQWDIKGHRVRRHYDGGLGYGGGGGGGGGYSPHGGLGGFGGAAVPLGGAQSFSKSSASASSVSGGTGVAG